MKVADHTSKNKQVSWPDRAGEYTRLVHDTVEDSHCLRANGLQPTILKLAGDCSAVMVLDAGCGDGWVLDALQPREGHGCDLCRFEGFPDRWAFSIADVRDLPYADAYFDVAISSLVLMWFAEFDAALSELHRVTRPGGRVVIALMHPYFYRTGQVAEGEAFRIERSLAAPFVIEDHHIAEAVGPFAYHYRPLPDYLNGCIRAGLRIEEVDDWFLDLADFTERFGSDQPGRVRRSGKVPMYTFIKCSRA